jgi:hypothetical protein
MTPSEFLRAVWPDEGIYCLAVPRGNGAFKHWTFDTVEEAAAYAAQAAGTADVYFNIHTLREKQVWDPKKVNARTSEVGGWAVRKQTNMVAAKCFFFDLDVGTAAGKYDSRQEALAGLIEFVKQTLLPKPLITSSGGGFHVYWLLTDPLPTDQWRDHATRLRQLAQHYGLKADPSRTTDSASVLRVVGTSNWKDRLNPRPVDVVSPGKPTATGVFVKALNEAIIRTGVTPQHAPQLQQAESLLGSNMDLPYDGPQPTMVAVLTACAQMRRIATLKGKISEPEWYRIAIGIGRFTENGHRNVHKLSSGHPEYSQSSCNAKVKQSESAQKGPSSCASVAYASGAGDSLCTGCPFQGRVYGPIQAALFKDPAPPPLHEEKIGDQVVVLEIPDPPKPFMRLKEGGGIAVVAKNADGTEEPQKIFDYDLYPLRRLSNLQQGFEQQVWHVALPRGEAKDFTLDADMLYDSRKFVVAIAHQGIYPHKGHIPTLQEYMVAYIAQLQKLADADAQCNHLGWGGNDQSHFIMPDKVMYPDGSVKPAQLSLGAQRASKDVHSTGTLEEQVKLMNFYNSPAYLPNQFFILAGLAAPIFFATGHHGVIINASGDAGASKSTSLYTAASFWGQPELYPINGTNNGATVRGRNERVTVLANLPVCVDEITHMPPRDAVDLAMSITQPGHRIRLQTDGVERASIGSYKATIMLATANNSLHGVLSLDNAAGTAGSMRVFEILFIPGKVHAKWEADEFLFKLKMNFGHIGEQFIYHVLKHKEAVIARVREVMKEIDTAANIKSSERFWSATAAAVLVAGEIAYQLGLLPYSVDALKRWLLDHQIPAMRGVVQSEYSDPMAIVADYLERINGNIIAMRKPQSNANLGVNIVHMPRAGELLAHYDLDERIMYVLKKGFKEYCAKTGANATKVIEELHQPRDGARIIPQTHTRRVLGAGTEFAKAQTWCFAINMDHASVSGQVKLEVVTGAGGGSTMGQQPTLSVVK